MKNLILSYVQAGTVLEARQAGQKSVAVSLDLGLTATEVALEPTGARLPDDQFLAWQHLEKIGDSERSCFVVENGGPRKVQVFSEASNRLYSLMPTEGAPTMLVSGIPMHCFKGIDPHRDTLLKIETIAPVVGWVLDTAIEAARTGEHVTTVEIEPAALEVARLNPWSQALFGNPKITQVVGDVIDEIQGFEDEAFDRIIHDPPAFNLAGDLYSGGFYRSFFEC